MKEKIIVFGVGNQGNKAFEELSKKHKIVYYADNNEKYVGSSFHGITVISGKKIADHLSGDLDVVVAIEKFNDVCEQIEEYNLSCIYVFIDGYIYEWKKKRKGSDVKKCKRCIMDDVSDDYIIFDKHGNCNYCNSAYKLMDKLYFPNDKEKRKSIIDRIKKNEKDKKYDCIMGVSGGLDSSYLLYLAHLWELRVLAVHIDDGFDTEISKKNVNKLIETTGYDYEVIKPDKEEYNDLILAYMKAGVANIATPQDNILFAFLYKKLREYGLKYFLSGENFSLECILQKGNTHSYMDLDNLMDIHKRFGTKSIDRLEFISNVQKKRDSELLGIETIPLLNYIDYNKENAIKELERFCGFEYYGSKHLENILTAFIQLYWFPKKFNVDKRKSHLSSMIVSGQISRDDAIKEVREPICTDYQMNEYINYVKQNLGLSDTQFDEIIQSPPVAHEKYKTGM